jgi:ubiquinone/menaquinone biosynthesis C-methylase UbiE
MNLLPMGVNSRALDVGAGSGRDAAWLVSRGFEVWAVEPSEVMRREAQKRHAEASIT